MRLPKHDCKIAAREIRLDDERDGTRLELARRIPPDERTPALDAARAHAEQQAKALPGSGETENQDSARATVG